MPLELSFTPKFPRLTACVLTSCQREVVRHECAPLKTFSLRRLLPGLWEYSHVHPLRMFEAVNDSVPASEIAVPLASACVDDVRNVPKLGP